MPTRSVRKPGLRTALPGIARVVRTACKWVIGIVLGVMYGLSSPASVAGSVLRIMLLDHKSLLEVSVTVTEVRHVTISRQHLSNIGVVPEVEEPAPPLPDILSMYLSQ